MCEGCPVYTGYARYETSDLVSRNYSFRTYCTSSNSNLVKRTYCPKPQKRVLKWVLNNCFKLSHSSSKNKDASSITFFQILDSLSTAHNVETAGYIGNYRKKIIAALGIHNNSINSTSRPHFSLFAFRSRKANVGSVLLSDSTS